MQLETYISDLLYRYECVIVPEFGAFLTQPVSASVDDFKNTFYPPKKALLFNEQIKNNDGLLAHYICEINKIPFEVASSKIAKRVKFLKSSLTEGKTISFENIGDIVLNKESKIEFEPSYRVNYLTESFGLSQLASPTITREIYKETVEEIEKEVPITITPEKRKSKPYLKYVAVGLIALTLGGLIASNYYVNEIEAHNKIAHEKAEQQLNNKIQQATFNLNPLPAIQLNTTTEHKGNYHVIAGAFRIEANSFKKVNQLKALGYNAKIIGVNNYGLYQVAYGSYKTGKEALQAVREVRKKYDSSAWIKVEEHN